jgi:hypothetical protein
MSDHPPPRRRFQFRLRTLMIGVTVFCLAAGWLLSQASIVWERKALLKRAPVWGVDDNDAGVSSVRHWFGDAGIGLIQLDASASDDELAQYRAAFPEASVFRAPVLPLPRNPASQRPVFIRRSATILTTPR